MKKMIALFVLTLFSSGAFPNTLGDSLITGSDRDIPLANLLKLIIGDGRTVIYGDDSISTWSTSYEGPMWADDALDATLERLRLKKVWIGDTLLIWNKFMPRIAGRENKAGMTEVDKAYIIGPGDILSMFTVLSAEYRKIPFFADSESLDRVKIPIAIKLPGDSLEQDIEHFSAAIRSHTKGAYATDISYTEHTMAITLKGRGYSAKTEKEVRKCYSTVDVRKAASSLMSDTARCNSQGIRVYKSNPRGIDQDRVWGKFGNI